MNSTIVDRQALRDFCIRLRLLHDDAGGPSVDSLGRDPLIPLRRSQIYDVLNARIKQPPPWQFIEASIQAFQRHARAHGRLLSVVTDLAVWRRDYSMLTYVDHSRRHSDMPAEAKMLPTQQILTYQCEPFEDDSGVIAIVTGDIRSVHCADIWVNSENTEMAMARITEFSISAIVRYEGAIRDRWGRVVQDLVFDELEREVAQVRPVAPTTALSTTSGDLVRSNGVRRIIHVAAVYGEPGAGFYPVQDLVGCLRAVLREAESIGEADADVHSILLPLFGTGSANAGAEHVAEILLPAAATYLRTARTPISTIYFLAYTTEQLDACTAVLKALPSGSLRCRVVADQSVDQVVGAAV